MSSDSASTASTTLDVRIWRSGLDGYEQFEVPRRENQTVLDVVTHVQRHIDPSLAYRFACRVGMCGSCAMTVNGRPRWTCRTHVAALGADVKELEIGPLANLPVLRDLAVDMDVFFERWKRARGRFVAGDAIPDDFARVEPSSKRRQRVDAGIECIGCGVCYAACDVVSWRDDYLGPAALNRAWCAHNDTRDAGTAERLRAVAASGGCASCHSQASCTEHCPKQLDPSAGIAGLRRTLARAMLGLERA